MPSWKKQRGLGACKRGQEGKERQAKEEQEHGQVKEGNVFAREVQWRLEEKETQRASGRRRGEKGMAQMESGGGLGCVGTVEEARRRGPWR